MTATTSTVQRARELFARQHNGADPRRDWPCPDPATQFLASCEWRLWEAYKRHRLDYLQGNGPDPDQNGTTDWVLGFYIKLANSETLQQVCETQCQSRTHADALLGVLFRDSDIICTGLPGGSAVFCSELVRNRLRAEEQRQEQRQAKKDGKTFAAILREIDRLTGPDDSPRKIELRKLLSPYVRPALETLAPAPSRTQTPKPGHPRLSGANMNTYLELVRRLVRQAYAGRDYVKKAEALIRDFSPTLLPKNYFTRHYPDKGRLSPLLDAFLKKPYPLKKPVPQFLALPEKLRDQLPEIRNMRERVDRYEEAYLTASSFTRLTATSSTSS